MERKERKKENPFQMDFIVKQELLGLQSKMILKFNLENGGSINEVNEEDELIQGDDEFSCRYVKFQVTGDI